MAIFRLALVGTGAIGDEHRADLPQYSTLAVDVLNGTITVSVVGRTAPSQMPAAGPPYWVTENGVNILVSMPESMVTAWWAKLAGLYPGHEPPYLPGFMV